MDWMKRQNAGWETCPAAKGILPRRMKYYTTALRLQPDDAEADFGLAKTLIAMNEQAKALPILERAVQLEPTNAAAHFRLSTLYREMGRTADSQHEVEEYKRYKEMKEKLEADFQRDAGTSSGPYHRPARGKVAGRCEPMRTEPKTWMQRSRINWFRTVAILLSVALAITCQPEASWAQANTRAIQGSASQSHAELPQLVDITRSTKIQFDHLSSPAKKYIVESMSGGVALIDYDRDGWPDIYFTNAPGIDMALAGHKARSALYHNNHDGTFTDVTEKAGVGYPCWAMGASIGDYDNDGWPDLLVTCFGGVVLYRNNHDGTFSNVTTQAGLGNDSGWATGAAFGDYDGDGWVDLFVAHYVDLDLKDLPEFGSKPTCQYHGIAVQCGPRGLKGSPDALYHNNGNGTFTEVSKAAGVDDAQKFFGLTAVWCDFNHDGRLDLFVANDGEPNYLYRNDGNGHFTDVALDAGVAVNLDGSEQANMGVALGDYEHKGLFSHRHHSLQ